MAAEIRSDTRIERLTPDSATARLPELVELLTNTVHNGDAIGFLAPLAPGEAEAFWRDVIEAIRSPYRVLLAAIGEGRVAGSVQLDYSQRSNGLHRAEVMKLMVDTSARRRGIGRALMEEAGRIAEADRRWLLVLDTREGDNGVRLYSSLGYITAGIIPEYAKSSYTNEMHGTVLMYKLLPKQQPA